MMDITKSREEFEAWVESDIDRMITMQCPIYRGVALSAWIASRESIVVELPQPAQWDMCEVLLDKKKVISTLRTAGVRIKGESE